MKNLLLNSLRTAALLMIVSPAILLAQDPNVRLPKTVELPNGWKLSPAGKQISLGDLPLNIAVSPDKKFAAVTNNGQSIQTIQLINLKKEMVIDSVIIGKSWLGLAFSENGRSLYASGGNDNIVIRYDLVNDHLINADTLTLGDPWPVKISVTGIAVDDDMDRLYAVTKEDNSLYIFDLQSKNLIKKLPLGGEGYTCLLSPDKRELYISCWGCRRLLIFDTGTMKIAGSIPVGDHPNDLCLTAEGRFLFVANANDNSVSVIDTRSRLVKETLNAALFPGAPQGSTTNSVALSEDDRHLFVANADNNCLAVFDVSQPGQSRSEGFIPAGWYPTCVRTAGNKILVANGKGLSSKANPYGPNPIYKGEKVTTHEGEKDIKMEVQYIGGLFKGTMSILEIPGKEEMAVFFTSGVP